MKNNKLIKSQFNDKINMAEEKKDKIKQLKEDYEKLQKKYNLPEFDWINQEFEIEKVKSGTFLLKEIRRLMIEKIASVLKLFELLMNPTAAPFFILIIIKNLSSETKKQIETIYKELAAIEVSMLKFDLSYNEKSEAEAIISISKKWKGYKEDILSICKNMEEAWNTNYKKSDKSYLG